MSWIGTSPLDHPQDSTALGAGPPGLVLREPAGPLATVLGPWLTLELPATTYSLPALVQPTVLGILNGGLEVSTADGRWHALPILGLSGSTSQPRLVRAVRATRLLIAAVRPGQLPHLLGIAGADLHERYMPLDDLLPGAASLDLAESAHPHEPLEALLSTAMQRAERPRTLVIPHDRLFQPLAQLADYCGMSERQFERRFRQSTGLSLRSYRQQWRCQRMLLEQVCGRRPASWAQIAAEADYTDQAHLHHALRRYAGFSPGQLARQLASADPAVWLYQVPGPTATRLLSGA